MLSHHRLTCSVDAGKLPRMRLKPFYITSPSNLLSVTAPTTDGAVFTFQNIEFPLTWFRSSAYVSDAYVSEREAHNIANIFEAIFEAKFNALMEFGQWLQDHPTYEFCGSYTECNGRVYSLNMAAYVKAGCDALDEFRTCVKRQTQVRISSVDSESAALAKKMMDSIKMAPLPPKPKVTFGEALDLAKELGL